MEKLKAAFEWLIDPDNKRKVDYVRSVGRALIRWYIYRKSTVEDKPDHRDFVVDGSEPKLGGVPKPNKGEFSLFNTYALDQTKDPRTRMACTAYAATLQLTIMQVRKKRDQSISNDPKANWEIQLKDPGTGSITGGDYLISALKSLRTQGKIKEYKVVPKDKWKDYLDKGYPLQTGIKCSPRFANIKNEWINTPNGYGHCVLVTGYCDKRQAFIAYDSSGNAWEKGTGRFYIPYKDHKDTFQGRLIRF